MDGRPSTAAAIHRERGPYSVGRKLHRSSLLDEPPRIRLPPRSPPTLERLVDVRIISVTLVIDLFFPYSAHFLAYECLFVLWVQLCFLCMNDSDSDSTDDFPSFRGVRTAWSVLSSIRFSIPCDECIKLVRHHSVTFFRVINSGY